MRITDADGAAGTGYSYTIGTGGPSVMKLHRAHARARACSAAMPTRSSGIWRDLLFLTHATTVGAITALALAAIDTALWDLRCRRAGLPLHVMAGGAQPSVPLYTTEGGWLHLEPAALVDDALRAKEAGFGGAKIKVGRPHVAEDVARLAAVRERGRPGDRDHDRRQPGLHRRRGDPPRAPLRAARHRLVRGAAARRRSRRATSALPRAHPFRSRSAKASTARCTSANTCRAAPARSCRSMSAASAASRRG